MPKNLGFSLPFSKELLCGGHNVGEIGRVPGLAGFLLRRDHAAEQDLQGTQILVFIKLCETTEVDTLKKSYSTGIRQTKTVVPGLCSWHPLASLAECSPRRPSWSWHISRMPIPPLGGLGPQRCWESFPHHRLS